MPSGTGARTVEEVTTPDPIERALAHARELADRLGDSPSAVPLGAVTGMLAELAAGSVLEARVAEPHLDALIILDECPDPVDLDAVHAGADSTWGVFAAEAPDLRLEARPASDGGWRLSGVKPWCSLAGRLSHALVTAHVGGERRLFAAGLGRGVTVDDSSWVARGMPQLPSGPATFDDVPAVAVGGPGWYLSRRGFEWGGIRVAACWWGAASSLAALVQRRAAERDSDLLHAAAGRAMGHERASGALLREVAAAVDAGDIGSTGDVAAQLVRTAVRRAADAILAEVAQALGPAPATQDPWYAAQTTDLSLYLLQDHGERDEARLSRLVAERAQHGEQPW